MTRTCAGIKRRVFVAAAAWWLVSSSAVAGQQRYLGHSGQRPLGHRFELAGQ